MSQEKYPSLPFYLDLYDRTERRLSFQAETPEEYLIWKSDLKKQLFGITGLSSCETCEPELTDLGEVESSGFLCRRLVLQTEPGVRMPFLLLRPTAREDALPVMIIPHGHGGGSEQALAGQAEFVRSCLDAGYIVALPDERGSGMRREFPEDGEEPEKKRANSHRELLQVGIGFGRSVIGTAVWDLMRLADWLLSLPETSDFLAVAGMSGGGQQTLYFAALDDRVQAAMISGYFYGMKDSLIALPQNCACNFVPHIYETADMGDLGAMIAPRPLFVESGREDPLAGARGLENVKEQLDITRKAYRLFHAEERLVWSVCEGGHAWHGTGMPEFLTKAQVLPKKKHGCVLVTGFEPFGGETVNPSWEAVRRLPQEICGYRVEKLQLPVSYDRSWPLLAAAIEENRPSVVICVGQAGGRSAVTVEQVAVNLYADGVKDNDGVDKQGTVIAVDGEDAFFSTLPVRKAVDAMRKRKIPAAVSMSAGTYVCNCLFYRLMQIIQSSHPEMAGGFIHVPYEPGQVLDGRHPSLPLTFDTEAIETAVQVALVEQSHFPDNVKS